MLGTEGHAHTAPALTLLGSVVGAPVSAQDPTYSPGAAASRGFLQTPSTPHLLRRFSDHVSSFCVHQPQPEGC